MNQDTLKLITAKIEKTLEQARVLKSEKVSLETLIADLRENLNEKDKAINELKSTNEQLLAEIRSLQEALNERDVKLQDSEVALLKAIETLDEVLDKENTTNNSLQGLFSVNEGNA
jgi:chromosome segregation ATPase